MTFYEEIAKLKQIKRRGWTMHNIPKNRLETDAEHTFSMIMLALELMQKNDLKLDQLKVIKMIAFHELCEIDAGDTTPADKISAQEKYDKEYNCIKRLSKTYDMPEIETLWLEYENQTSPEGKFVEMIDRVDAILQSEIYSKEFNNPEIEKDFKLHAKQMYEEFKKLNFK